MPKNIRSKARVKAPRARARKAPATPSAAGAVNIGVNPGLSLVAGNAVASAVVRQRILSTIDPLSQSASSLSLTPARTLAVANLYLGMQQLNDSLFQLGNILASRILPAQIIGVLVQPDGSGAGRLQVQFDPGSLGGTGIPLTILTDDTGTFHLQIPSGLSLPDNASLTLAVHGANGNATVSVGSSQIAANGLVGSVSLP